MTSSSSGRHDTDQPNGSFLFRSFVTVARCALGLHEEILSTNDVRRLYSSLSGQWSHQKDARTGEEVGGEVEGEVGGEVGGEGTALGQIQEEPKEEQAGLSSSELLGRSDEEQTYGVPQEQIQTPETTQPEMWPESDLEVDGPSDSSSDEGVPTTIVMQKRRDKGDTNIYVTAGHGTCIQIGRRNEVSHHNANRTQREESSSESSGDSSSEPDSSLEASPPPQPSRRHHPRPKRHLSPSASVTPTQPSATARAPSSTRDDNRSNSSNSSSNNNSSNIVNNSPRNASATNGNLVQSQQQPMRGRCPSGVDVGDIVEESGSPSEGEDEEAHRVKERTRRTVEEPEEEEDEEVPFPRSNMFVDVDEEMFVGREKEFAELNKQLMKNKIAGVSGMGGSGKTTFVHLYAYKHKKRYNNGMFFVDASNIHTLPLNFAQLAGPELLDLVRQPEENIPDSIKKVAHWLKVNKDYLLIFDAADHENILNELGMQRPLDNFRYIPPREQLKGHVLITTRQPPDQLDSVRVRYPVMLGDLGMRDTCEFLCQRVYPKWQTDLEEEVRAGEMRYLKELVESSLPGRLPLHLEQTASFIRRRKWTFADYLAEVRHRKGRNPTSTPSHGDNRKTIDDAFTANFDDVEQESEEAAALLNLAAVCHSRNIPYALFTVGAMVMTNSDRAVEGSIDKMVNYLMNNSNPSLEDLELGEKGVFEDASKGGRLAMLKLLAVPDKSQLVKFKRSAEEGSFTVHEVIQQLLQERMNDKNEMVPALRTLATILIYMLKSDDVSLANKRLFLAHAEKCAENMLRYGPFGESHAQSAPAQDDDSDSDSESELPFSELYQRLRIRTAFVFAWLGSFPTAWEIIEDLEKRMSPSGGHQLRVELLSLKARICVWQHQPAQALQYGKQGLELAGPLNINNTELLLEYAFLHKSCAHALLTQYEINSITQHLSKAKGAFEIIMRCSQTYCREEYAHLLMLHGLLHRNVAERCPDNQRTEYEQAKTWFAQAIRAMDVTDYTIETCKVHLYLVEVSLQSKSVVQAVEDLEGCRHALEFKLGSHHRYTAWVLDKMAGLLVEIGRRTNTHSSIMFDHVARALKLSEESLKIQEIVYGRDCGKVQMGQTRLILGEALLLMQRYGEASDCLEKAERLLEATPKHPAYDKVRQLLRQTRDAVGQDNFRYHLQPEENSTMGTDKWDDFTQSLHGDNGVVVSDPNRNVAPSRGTGSGERKPCMNEDLACPLLGQDLGSRRTSGRKGREVRDRNSLSLGTPRQQVLNSR